MAAFYHRPSHSLEYNVSTINLNRINWRMDKKMKFDKNIASGWVLGSCLGVILAEIAFHPSVISHLITANVMLVLAIVFGFISGESGF